MKSISSYLASLLTGLILATNSAFAASFQFDANNQEPLYQTRLPKAVYAQSKNNTLQDLTIHNATGEQLPYALMSYTSLYPQSLKKVESTPLLVFAIEEAKLSQPDALRIHLGKTGANTTLDIATSEINDKNVLTNVIYLIDAGEKHPALQTLSIDWQGAEGQLVGLEVLASNDLKNWSHIGNAVLLKTTQAGNSILNNTATFNGSSYARYLQIRLNEPKKSPDFKLTSVNAQYHHRQTITQPFIWQDLKFLTRTQDKKTGEIKLEFEALGRYPTSRLQIHLPQTNTITNVTISVRNKTNEPWTYLTNSGIYNMTQQGNTITNPDITLNTTTARYWQLQFNQAHGGIGEENPSLSVGWLPDIIVWNARGDAPFSLNVGEKPDLVNKVSISNLIPNAEIEIIKKLPQAKLVSSSNKNTDTIVNKQSTWTSAPDYKTWSLWGGLLLGVLLLAGMAYSLVKTDRKNSSCP